MRPVNLIPSDERRGERTALRGGPLAYIVVGALVAALAGVTALVLTDNQISDRKAEVAKLKQQDAVAKARAERLAAYTQFGSVRDQRVATVTSLADSRFDWERVMRELSLILPDDVWLTNLTGKANPAVRSTARPTSRCGPRSPGPPWSWSAAPAARRRWRASSPRCKDVDGVTRVGVQSSQLGTQQSGAGTATTHRHHQRQLPDPRLHRPVPDRRRLRRRPRPGGLHRLRARPPPPRPPRRDRGRARSGTRSGHSPPRPPPRGAEWAPPTGSSS